MLAILPFTEEVKAALLLADAELQAAYNEVDSKLSIQWTMSQPILGDFTTW